MSEGGSECDGWRGVLDEWFWDHDGIRCRVVAYDAGHYCGYVESSFGIQLGYDDFQTWPHHLIEIHGGLTYGVDEDGWLGFDCNHAGDVCVDEEGNSWGTTHYIGASKYGKIWTLEEVKEETERLAEQVNVLQEFVEKADLSTTDNEQ